jgi:hypothetical protein
LSADAPASFKEKGRESDWALLLVDFNLRLSRFAHRSWYGVMPGLRSLETEAFDTQGRPGAQWDRPLSVWLAGELGVRGSLDWQMSEPQKRLWLLDTPTLERLAREVALAMHRDWLLRMIDGPRVRDLSAKLDRGALQFVVQAVPERSLHYNSPVVSFETAAPGELAARLQDAGARTLMALLQSGWDAVRRRAQLHFDKALMLGDVPAFEGTHAERAMRLICGQLIPGRFGEWAWLF